MRTFLLAAAALTGALSLAAQTQTLDLTPGSPFTAIRVGDVFEVEVVRGDTYGVVVETNEAYLLSLDLPGIDRDTLDVTLDDGTLKISGQRRHETEVKDGKMHRVERAYGRFFRSFSLGSDLDPEAIEASYDDGVLTVRVGKSEARQPRRIPIGSRVETRQIEEATEPSDA